MEPFMAKNAAVFDTPGWGQKIFIILSARKGGSWEYYFKHSAKYREPLPEDPDLPGLLHYRDSRSKSEEFFSHDHPTSEMTHIDCPESKNAPSPHCEASRRYRGRYGLSYTFQRAYLSHWREIDAKVQALLDSFIKAEATSLVPIDVLADNQLIREPYFRLPVIAVNMKEIAAILVEDKR